MCSYHIVHVTSPCIFLMCVSNSIIVRMCSGSMVTEIRCSCHIGHSKAITGLAMSQDNRTLMSSSCDGSLRVWNVWMRQCLRKSKPLHKAAISNMLVRIHTNISCLVDSILSMRCMYVCMGMCHLRACMLYAYYNICILRSFIYTFMSYPYVHMHFYYAQ